MKMTEKEIKRFEEWKDFKKWLKKTDSYVSRKLHDYTEEYEYLKEQKNDIAMKIIYTWHDLGRYAKNAAKSLLTGVIRLQWVIILLVINIIATALIWGKNAIKKKPCLSVLATFVVMLLFIAVVHMRMKVKLTTAEWQRDSLEQKLDSIKVANGTKVSYYKYQPYKPKE